MIKLTIKKSRFLDWYFDYGQDQENQELRVELANSIIDQMYKTGFGSCSVQELFDNSNHDSIRYCFTEECKDEDNDMELQDLFKEFEVTLID